MNLISSEACERHWCTLCPDLIMPGEDVVSGDGFKDPLGDPGYAHRDCAEDAGHVVAGEVVPLNAVSAPRLYVRGVARTAGDDSAPTRSDSLEF